MGAVMDFAPEHTYAVVVGIGHYEDGDLPDLDGPAEDALKFASWLLKRGVRPEKIRLFLSRTENNQELAPPGVPEQPATREAISCALCRVLPEQPGTLLWVFWGGHGVTQRDGCLRLFFQDATQRNKLNLDLNALVRLLGSNAYPAGGWQRQILVVDACRTFASQQQWRYELPVDGYAYGTEVKGREQFVIYAARPGEYAEEETQAGSASGLLSRELLKLLPVDSSKPWPPDIAGITNQLVAQFRQMRSTGAAAQVPTFFSCQDWDGTARAWRNPGVEPGAQARVRARDPKCAALAKALCELDLFSTSAARAQFVAALQLEDVAWGENQQEHAETIINGCQDSDWGFAALLDALDARKPEHVAGFAAKLDEVVGLNALNWVDLLGLLRLIGQGLRVGPGDVATALRRCRQPVPGGISFFRAVAILARLLATAEGSHPLFRFLEHCREHLPADTLLADFDAWEQEIAEKNFIDLKAIRAEVERFRKSRVELGKPGAPLAAASLQVKIAPSAGPEPAGRYGVAAWLRGDWLPGQVKQVMAIKPGGQAELSQLVLEAVRAGMAEIESSVAANRPMRIEVFLPMDLLDFGLDQVEVPRGRNRRVALGTLHPVLARSYDRFYDSSDFLFTRGVLRDRWSRGQRRLAAKEVAWALSAEAYDQGLCESLDQEAVALVALQLPTAQSPGLRTQVLDTILGSGLPFALFLRDHQGQASATRAQIEAEVLAHPPAAWPQDVTALRTHAARLNCKGLTLFWDDPFSVPPDVTYQLQQPL